MIFVFHLFCEAGCEQFKWPSGPSVANNFDLKLCSTSLGSEWRAGAMVSSSVAHSQSGKSPVYYHRRRRR